MPGLGQGHKDTKNRYGFYLSEKEERIARKTVDAVPNAFGIHKTLGPGLLEKVYEVCFCHELSKRGLEYQRQVDVLPIASGYMME